MEQVKKPDSRLSWIIFGVLIIVIALLPAVLYGKKNKGAADSGASRLLISDPASGKLYLADDSGKQLAKYDVPKSSLLVYQASSANGNLLLSANTNTDDESFLYIKDGKVQDLSKAVNKQLSLAVHLGTSHQIWFAGENFALFTDCSGDQSDCRLVSLNLLSGNKKQVLDTGYKLSSPDFPGAYLVGYDQASNLAYMRIQGDNSLNISSSAVYAVDVRSGKVKNSFEVPSQSGYSLALSHDYKQAVYYTIGQDGKVNLHLFDLSSGKNTQVPWTKAMMPSFATFHWSPDDSKILFATAYVNRPAAEKGGSGVTLAYLDVAKRQINKLQDSKTDISAEGWADSEAAIYGTLQGSGANTKDTVFKQLLSGGNSKLNTPSGLLIKTLSH